MDFSTAITKKTCPSTEIAAYLDGELAPDEELALEAHVANCRDCLAELNLQKEMLTAMDFSLEAEAEIELPQNFAKVVAVRAESGVSGLRSKEERFRALFLCTALFLITLIILGAETQNVLAASGKLGEQMLTVITFAGHLVYNLSFGVTVILRSLSGQFVFNSLISFVIVACLLALSAAVLSRLISRYNRS